jgi:3-phenylpropionate/trans-cinnamate dioxygenase ferredoxin reductase subunit
VVIGGGVGSAAAVAELRKQGFDGSLTLVSAENTVPYERPPLSKGFLLGTSGQVPVKDAAWYEQASVELILGSRATRLDLAARTVTLSGGAVLGYDQLLLATGVRPRVLPGLDGDGVCYLRTGEDAAALRDRMTAAGHVAVLGGGFIGCEVAAAAIRLGKRATILEALPTLLLRALGPELGDVVAGIHRDEGVDVRTGQQVLGIRPRRGGVRISTAAGDVDADVLVVGVGTVPNTELAEQAGLPAGHGIEVDECFATAAPGIYAIGDVAAQHLPGTGGASGSSTTTPPSGTGASRPATWRASASRSPTSTGSGPINTTTPSPARGSSRDPTAPGSWSSAARSSSAASPRSAWTATACAR